MRDHPGTTCQGCRGQKLGALGCQGCSTSWHDSDAPLPCPPQLDASCQKSHHSHPLLSTRQSQKYINLVETPLPRPWAGLSLCSAE